MYGLTTVSVRMRVVVCALAVLLALFAAWLVVPGLSPELARDFEECVDLVRTNASSDDELNSLMTDCNVRFAGRRKPDGGYTYYDFMQDRHFDIAGPNPTAEELKQIDREYMGYLDAQTRETVSAQLARRQNELLRAEMESARQAVGPPIVLTPAKRAADRSKPPHCGDGALSCSWTRFSTAVKNAFASSTRTKP